MLYQALSLEGSLKDFNLGIRRVGYSAALKTRVFVQIKNWQSTRFSSVSAFIYIIFILDIPVHQQWSALTLFHSTFSSRRLVTCQVWLTLRGLGTSHEFAMPGHVQ